MSRPGTDLALDALLADIVPPPVPAGLAERATAAAVAQPQDSRPAATRFRRDRRGAWMRRPLVVGAAAMGLLVSSAVAATMAGVPFDLPPKVQSVLAEVPLIGRKFKAEPPAARRVERLAAAQPSRAARSAPAVVADAEVDAVLARRSARRARRLEVAREIVEARRAAGLPTPRADRIERRAARRQARLEALPPERRAAILERAAAARRERVRARIERVRARLEARRARDDGPAMRAEAPTRAERGIEPVPAPLEAATDRGSSAATPTEPAMPDEARRERIRARSEGAEGDMAATPAERWRAARDRRFERWRRLPQRRPPLRRPR